MADAVTPMWRRVLEQCGYPLDAVVLDFETYSDSVMSLRKMSTIEYIKDSRFEVLGLAVLEVNQPFPDYEQNAQCHLGPRVDTVLDHLKREYGDHLEGCTVIAQNAKFDTSILHQHYGITPPFVVDTLALARHWNSRMIHGLAALCEMFKLPPKLEIETSGWTYRQRFAPMNTKGKGPKLPIQRPRMTREQEAELAKYAANDAMREWELFTLLLPRLSTPKTELRIMQHTLDLYRKPVLRVDFERAETLKQEMQQALDAAIQPTGLTPEELSGDKSFSAALSAALNASGDTVDRYTKQGKRGTLLAIAKDDPERELLEKHPAKPVRELMAARIAGDAWPTHMGRIDSICAQARALGGLLAVPLKYHGAHTGRWSGDEAINLQNLGSRGHPLVSAIRELLIAPPDHLLVIADASQIEARVLAWIAGQWDLVEAFANNKEVYAAFASKVLGWPVRKPRKDGIPAIEARHKWARNAIGKVGVLGCGYGMGSTKAEAYANGEITFEQAEAVVKTYRAENQQIVQFWYDVEEAFRHCLQYKRTCIMPRGLRFDHTPYCDVILTLPSGRELKYQDVRIKQDRRGPKLEVYNHTERHWGHLWGGTITENVVQAISRDILWGAIDRLEEMGHHTGLHVHDELIAVVPSPDAPRVLELAVQELSRRPAWGSELPLAAEGVVSAKYGGH